MRKCSDILLVGKLPSHHGDFVEALKTDAGCIEIHHVSNCQEARAFLWASPRQRKTGCPNLILLAPASEKKQVPLTLLKDLKAHAELRRIPVVVFVQKSETSEIGQYYRLYANCCVEMPVEPERFKRMIDAIRFFWLNIVELPSE
ncbi:MAG: hypothetical protein HY537_10300 [Deltaproteobacteria bacterium]|nr:hypothetical protein [Deltaproteobacteria bacterium]